ncbi:unnamed protein product [Rotaria magnacalcarata]|uniref:Uncharacterized protein n=1 Tax=Rotaria magnacalcarata TaxID=392030 RepID=A0A815TLN2_9BILA|nr:unnamed protein product [Rotaria magnacalcarata]
MIIFLLHSLRLQLNCSIKRKKEQRFTLSRLELFDKLFCLHQIHHLYQKYLDFVTYQNLFGNEANKIIQELKRRKLNDQLKNYALKLQHYEDLYQTEIDILESKLIQTSLKHQPIQVDIFMTLSKCYLSHYTNRLIRQIRYKEAWAHVKLVRQHRRHLLSKQQIVDVYPQIIVDVPKIPLNRIQLDYLSKSGRVSSMNMPTTGTSKFLDKLIRPIFDKHARSTTIIGGVDLIHRLEAYTTNGYLKPKTYLCPFDITD